MSVPNCKLGKGECSGCQECYEDNTTYCCECGREIKSYLDEYADNEHETLCEDCLLMLHKKFKGWLYV